MAHSKAYMLQLMADWCCEIIASLKLENVVIKDDQLAIPENSDKLKADFIRAGFYWLQSVYVKQYGELRDVKDLLPEEVWTRYRTWDGFENLRESNMLREALVDLRKTIVSRDRPDFFKKTKIQKKIKAATKK